MFGFQFIDVVLYLPGTVDTSNDRLIDDDGTIYPLIKASDYSAIVTLSILFEGADAPMDKRTNLIFLRTRVMMCKIIRVYFFYIVVFTMSF